jgi:hypothetical protein
MLALRRPIAGSKNHRAGMFPVEERRAGGAALRIMSNGEGMA